MSNFLKKLKEYNRIFFLKDVAKEDIEDFLPTIKLILLVFVLTIILTAIIIAIPYLLSLFIHNAIVFWIVTAILEIFILLYGIGFMIYILG